MALLLILCTSEEPVSNKYVEHVSDHEWSLISAPNIRPDFDDNSISLEMKDICRGIPIE